MTKENTTLVDFVARGDTADEWKMVLVEQGPWSGASISSQLGRLQERLYGAVDSALDGRLAEKFPESKGKKIIIRVYGYNLPKLEVAEFLERFSKGVFSTTDYQLALQRSPFVSDISFQANFEVVN
jgi:hypothetical protein